MIGELLSSEVVQGRVVSQVFPELQIRDQDLQVLIAQGRQVELGSQGEGLVTVE